MNLRKKIIISSVLLTFLVVFVLIASVLLLWEKEPEKPNESIGTVGEFDDFVLQSTDFTTMSEELAFTSARYVMYNKSVYAGQPFTMRGEVCFLHAKDGGLQYLVLTLSGGSYEKDGVTYTRTVEVLFDINGSYRIPYSEFINEFTESYDRELTITGRLDTTYINDQEILYLKNAKILSQKKSN